MIGNVDLFGGIRTLASETDGTATTFYSDVFNVGGGVSGDVLLTVYQMFAGTGGTFDVTIEHSHDLTTWATLASFTQATGATSESEALASFSQYIRAKCVLDGTTALVTFKLKGVIRAD